jgi:hypothetical protein
MITSVNMKAFFEDILGRPYCPNSQSDPQHENQVADVFREHGFVIISKKEFKQKYSSDYSLLPDMTAVHQPNGSQQPPDFVFKINGKTYGLECKSGSETKTCPMYNSTNPGVDTFYVFCCKKYNETTVFIGGDVMPERIRKRIEYAWSVQEAIVDETNDELSEMEENTRGFQLYPRRMVTQQGPNSMVDYFTHAERSWCESNVLNYDW